MRMRGIILDLDRSYWLANVPSPVSVIPLLMPLLIIPPILATLGFNLTRRYKEPPPSQVESKEHTPQKPPLSVGRIAGEILVGTGVGFAAGLLAGFGFLLLPTDKGCFKGVNVLVASFFFVFPMVYGAASPVGVYLVGRRGRQTGSLLWALACGFAAGMVITVMRIGAPYVPDVAFFPLVLLVPPLVATYAFNLTRRHKEPVSPRS